MQSIAPQLAAAGLYAGLLILMNIGLQVAVIRMRRSKLIGLGDGQDKEMIRAVRAHGNFAENAPFAIAALILMALLAAPFWLMHVVGLLLVGGRAAHAYGVSRSAGSSPGRVGGMVATFTGMTVAALTLIFGSFL